MHSLTPRKDDGMKSSIKKFHLIVSMRPIVLQRYGENLLTIDNILSEGMVSGCREDCETTERERELERTPFPLGSLKCHSSSISNTAWSSSLLCSPGKACAHSRINRTFERDHSQANIEFSLSYNCFPRIILLLHPCVLWSGTIKREELVKQLSFVMRFMTSLMDSRIVF